jgi:hypothetical protein
MASSPVPPPRERSVTIIALDPSVRIDGEILLAKINIPAERLQPGPIGYRVEVIDFDSTTDTLYLPGAVVDGDPWASKRKRGLGDALVRDPELHRHNAYALVMRTLGRFEQALGRRVSWGFDGHQLKVAPHAFSDANAFYSEKDTALLFGYFPGADDKPVFTCLSHDVIVHETTHALVDGLRDRYREPSSPDQAAFHEGFADVVALLSVFSLPAVIAKTIDNTAGTTRLDAATLTPDELRKSRIFGLAKQVGEEVQAVRGKPLRRSLELDPNPQLYLTFEEFKEAHRRGEILVAAMLTAFVNIWSARLVALLEDRQWVDRSRVIEEGADIADCLLTSAIRALDYAPPVDVTFGDYLCALLTADREIRPSDTRYDLRRLVREAFASYGITPVSSDPEGYWDPAPERLDYSRTHFEAMRRDKDEVFRFVWENREELGLNQEAFTRVVSVRPCTRTGPDGFVLHETVCVYEQILEPLASELGTIQIRKPQGMPEEKKLRLFGGGALIFDEYGRLKYHVHNRLPRDKERATSSSRRQQDRLDFLWTTGALRGDSPSRLSFSRMHLRRGAGSIAISREEW